MPVPVVAARCPCVPRPASVGDLGARLVHWAHEAPRVPAGDAVCFSSGGAGPPGSVAARWGVLSRVRGTPAGTARWACPGQAARNPNRPAGQRSMTCPVTAYSPHAGMPGKAPGLSFEGPGESHQHSVRCGETESDGDCAATKSSIKPVIGVLPFSGLLPGWRRRRGNNRTHRRRRIRRLINSSQIAAGNQPCARGRRTMHGKTQERHGECRLALSPLTPGAGSSRQPTGMGPLPDQSRPGACLVCRP